MRQMQRRQRGIAWAGHCWQHSPCCLSASGGPWRADALPSSLQIADVNGGPRLVAVRLVSGANDC